MTKTDYEHGVVPQEQRRGWFALTMVWIAIGIDLSGAFLGIELAAGMDFGPAIGAIILGSVVLGVLAIGTSYIGAKTGLSTAMISRIVFGRIGGALLSLVLAISLLGWFSVQAGFFGLHAKVSVMELFGWDVPIWVMTAIGGVLMLLTALWGYRSISKLSEWAVPLLLILLVTGVVVALSSRGSEALWVPSAQTFTFGTVVSLVISIFVTGIVVTPDFARWAKSTKQAMIAGFVGFFIGNSFIVVIAMILAKVMDAEDLITIFFALGLGGAAVIVLILAQWTTNTTNLYSTSLSFSSLSPKLNRRTVTVVAGIIGIVISVLGAADYFVTFLTVIGIVVAPFGGVYIATFLFDLSGKRFAKKDARATVEPIAVIAWVVGIAVAASTGLPEEGGGFGLFTLTTISSIDGLLAGFVVYAVATLIARRGITPGDNAEASVDTEAASPEGSVH